MLKNCRVFDECKGTVRRIILRLSKVSLFTADARVYSRNDRPPAIELLLSPSQSNPEEKAF
jgi:hypothetical protein